MIYTNENWKPSVTYCEPNKVEVQRMTTAEAIEVITDYLNEDTAVSPYNSRFIYALNIAREALRATEHDGCKGCKYTHKDQYEMPCLMCKQSKQDLWEEKK